MLSLILCGTFISDCVVMLIQVVDVISTSFIAAWLTTGTLCLMKWKRPDELPALNMQLFFVCR